MAKRIADALRTTGSFSHLLRFHPAGTGAPLTLDQLLEGAFATTGAASIAAVILGFGAIGSALHPALGIGGRICHAVLPNPGKGRTDWSET